MCFGVYVVWFVVWIAEWMVGSWMDGNGLGVCLVGWLMMMLGGWVVRWLGKCLVSGLEMWLGGCFTVFSWDWVSG